MDLLRLYSNYAQGILLESMGKECKRPSTEGLNDHWHAQAQIDRIVHQVIEACGSPGKRTSLRIVRHRTYIYNAAVLPYDLDEVLALAEAKVPHKDERLRAVFGVEPSSEGQRLPIIDRPAVYVDAKGTIVGWYLPYLFSQEVSVSVPPSEYLAELTLLNRNMSWNPQSN